MIENQTTNNSTTQSFELFRQNSSKSETITQSLDIIDSQFITIDTCQQIQNLTKSSRIASPIRVEPEQEKNKQQINEMTSAKLEKEKYQFKSPLRDEIKKITFDNHILEEISEQLDQIEANKQTVIQYGLKPKIKEIENFEIEIKNKCAQWEIISKKGSKILSYFHESQYMKQHKQTIINTITSFHKYLKNFVQDDNFTVSQFYIYKGLLQEGDINLTLKFTFHTVDIKSEPIEIDIHHSQYNSKYELFLTEITLLKKLEEKMIKNEINDLQFWSNLLKKQIELKKNHVFLDYEFDRESKQLTLHTHLDQAFIITKDSCPIYLGENMTLKSEKNQEIIVHYAQLNPQAQNQKFCLQEQNKIASKIQDNSKDLIKLQYTKQLQNNQMSKNYEFFLRNQQIELSPHLPQFKGVLQHDSNGFIIRPHENQKFKLQTEQTLISTQRKMSFSLELNDDVWLEIEYDLDNLVFII